MNIMTSIVIYYSLLGHNRTIAEEIAELRKCEILEFAPGSILRVFQFFMRHKKLRKKAQEVDLSDYNEIIICGPIWAGKPAPAIKYLLESLDLKGKVVRFHFTFTQNYGNTEGNIRGLMEKKGADLKLIKFKNISKHKDKSEMVEA